MYAVRRCRLIAVLLIAAFALTTLAQNPPPPPTSGPGGFSFDPAAIRERITAVAKAALDCPEEEWKIIEPKIFKIALLRLDVSSFGSFVIPIRGVNRGGISALARAVLDPNAPPSQVEEKANALRQLVDNNETSNNAYTNAIAALRKAREKAKADLAAAQKDLTNLLTIRQEALLVELGTIE